MVSQAWSQRQGRCVRGQGGSKLPSSPLAARFAIISSHTQDLHHKPLALSSLPLLRFLPPLPGHFSLFFILKSLGVQRAEGWGTRTDGWSKRGVRAKGGSCLSSMSKVFPWFCPTGQRYPRTGNHVAQPEGNHHKATALHKHTHTHKSSSAGGKWCSLVSLELREFHLRPRDYAIWAVLWWFFFSPGPDVGFLE